MGSSRRTRSSLLHVFSFTQILILFFSYSFFYKPHPINTLEIIIGGEEAPPPYGDDCPDCSPPPEPPICPEPIPPPPPPPEECPPPPPPNHPPPPPPNPPPPPPPNHPPPSPPNHPPPPPPNHPPPPPPVPAPKPPPPPPPTPTPLPPELAAALKVIQRFGNTITADPQGVTKTWHGPICKDPKAYRGFKCDTTISDNKLRVALVNFNGFNLNGNPLALINFLEGLTDLIVFHANSNNFFGQVPAGINKIPSLYEFDLSNNKLAGEFPKSVLTATNLTFLDLRFNRLTGKLPPQVFTLDLDVLYLNNNQFTGNIPENIGKTPVLYLTLANNQLTGQIPKSIGQASGPLREALLLNNKLSGCLPYEIGKLKSATVFDVSVNGLKGPIPHSFGCLENMGYLNLSYNKFYGAVPENLCGLSRLVEVTLTSNYFTQVGPKCRRLITEGKLDVIKNCILDLPSQRSAAECAAFFLKQQSCPDPQSLNIVPCKIGNSAEPRAAAGGRKLMGPPRSYAALRRPGPE